MRFWEMNKRLNVYICDFHSKVKFIKKNIHHHFLWISFRKNNLLSHENEVIWMTWTWINYGIFIWIYDCWLFTMALTVEWETGILTKTTKKAFRFIYWSVVFIEKMDMINHVHFFAGWWFQSIAFPVKGWRFYFKYFESVDVLFEVTPIKERISLAHYLFFISLSLSFDVPDTCAVVSMRVKETLHTFCFCTMFLQYAKYLTFQLNDNNIQNSERKRATKVYFLNGNMVRIFDFSNNLSVG